MIGLLLSALNPFKMILFWGLKKIPLLLEIPTLKDHLTPTISVIIIFVLLAVLDVFFEVVLSSLESHSAVKFFKPQEK